MVCWRMKSCGSLTPFQSTMRPFSILSTLPEKEKVRLGAPVSGLMMGMDTRRSVLERQVIVASVGGNGSRSRNALAARLGFAAPRLRVRGGAFRLAPGHDLRVFLAVLA